MCPKLVGRPPAVLDSDDLDVGAVAGAAVAGAVALLAIIFVCMMIRNEKKGTPMFTSLDPGAKTSATV